MAINKVVYGNDTLVDLTEDSVTANTLLEGETAHNAAGEQITGTAKQGHIVKNPSGTAMTQRANLQFVDAKVSDDSTNGATKVEVVREVTDQEWEDATEDGLYATDDDDPVFSADMISYGDGTVEDALDGLIKVITMTPNISVPANGYNFCNYTIPTGYRLISVNMGSNSLALFCQISRFGGVDRLSFFNAYTQSLTVDKSVSLVFVKA